jgi:pre-peptidase/concanavalin A-like lectin/glucanase superfamily protein
MNGPSKTYPRNMVALLAAIWVLTSVAHGASIPLSNGVPVTGLSGTIGSEVFYTIDVPAGQDLLEISISGGTGDCDLYVRKDLAPTLTNYDYRPYKVGNFETVTLESPAAGAWCIMLRAYTTYGNLTLLATYSAASSPVAVLENGVPLAGLAGVAGSEVFYSFEVPAGQPEMEISIAGGNGDCDLYVKYGALPTVADFDYRPFLLGNNETVTVDNPTGGTWYIMLRGYSAYDGVTLLGTRGGGLGTLLQNGVALPGLAGGLDSTALYRIELPADQNNVEIMISGGTGDCDLYVKQGTPPTLADFDYRPYLSGNDEIVTIPSPAEGPWYVMLHGYSAYSGVTLVATYGDIVALEDEVPIRNIEDFTDREKFYKFDVPAGQTSLEITISGGSGNCDLYVKKGVKPTVSNWDYRPYLPGNNETVKITLENKEAATWYIMLRARQNYRSVTLMADYWFDGSVTLLANNTPVTGISGGEGSERYFRLLVPSHQKVLEFRISGGTGDADLYVKLDAVPSITSYDYRPYLIGNNETVTIEDPPTGNWLIMVRGYHEYAGLTIVGSFGSGTGGGEEVIELTSGVPVTDIEGAFDSEAFFKIDVPSDQAQLEIMISGGTGDADLYIKKDEMPTLASWDYRPYLIGNNETVTIDLPEAGTYYLMVKGYTAYAGVSVQATYWPIAEAIEELTNDVPVSGLSGMSGDEKLFKIEVPAGQDFLTIVTSGSTGDCDLYVRRGEEPTQSSWDYRPYFLGSNEIVEVENPTATTWYIMLHAYQTYSGLTLVASYGTDVVGNNFAADLNCVALWNMEPGELTVDNVGTNTLTASGGRVESNTAHFKQGMGSGRWVEATNPTLYIRDADLDPGFPLKNGTSNKDISVCMWVKFDSLFRQTHMIWAKHSYTGMKQSFAIYAAQVSGRYHLRIAKGYNWGSGQETLTEANTALQPGRWYHVAVTWDNSRKELKTTLWDDTGATVHTESAVLVYGISSTDAHVELGTYDGTDGNPDDETRLDGSLDEIAVFNDVLTNAEIAGIRQGTYGK